MNAVVNDPLRDEQDAAAKPKRPPIRDPWATPAPQAPAGLSPQLSRRPVPSQGQAAPPQVTFTRPRPTPQAPSTEPKLTRPSIKDPWATPQASSATPKPRPAIVDPWASSEPASTSPAVPKPKTPAERGWLEAGKDRLMGAGAAGLDTISGVVRIANQKTPLDRIPFGAEAFAAAEAVTGLAKSAAPILPDAVNRKVDEARGALAGMRAADPENLKPRSEYAAAFADKAGEYAAGARDVQSDKEKATRQRLAEVQDEGFFPTIKELATNPSALATAGDSLIPMMAAGGGAGGLARAAATRLGAGAAAGAVGTGAQLGTMAAMEGAGAGDAAYNQVMQAKQEVLDDDPGYLRVLAQVKDPAKAREALAQMARSAATSTGTAASLALMGAGQKLGLNVAEDAVLGNTARGAGASRIGNIVGGGAREFVGEAAEGAGNQMAQNVGAIAGGVEDDVFRGVPGAAAAEGVAGFAAGGAGGLARPVAGAASRETLADVIARQQEQAEPLALPPPEPIRVGPDGVAITPQQAQERAELGLTPDIIRTQSAQWQEQARQADANAAALAQPRNTALTAPLALPPPAPITVDSSGNAATPAQTEAAAREREALGLTPDVQRVQARNNSRPAIRDPWANTEPTTPVQGDGVQKYHPTQSQPTLADGSPLPNPNNGPASRMVNTAAQNGAIPTVRPQPQVPFPDAAPGSMADVANSLPPRAVPGLQTPTPQFLRSSEESNTSRTPAAETSQPQGMQSFLHTPTVAAAMPGEGNSGFLTEFGENNRLRSGRPPIRDPWAATADANPITMSIPGNPGISEAAHLEPGQPPQPATPAVVAQSAQAVQRAPNVTMAQAKKNVLGQIDAALADANTDAWPDIEGRQMNRPGARQAAEAERDRITQAAGYVTFDVPGDGTFRVVNNRSRLEAFRSQVERQFKNTSLPAPKLPSLKPSDAERARIMSEAEQVDDDLFSRASVVQGQPTGKGLPVANVERIAQDFMRRYRGNIPLQVRVGATVNDLYGVGADQRAEFRSFKGAYHPRRGVLALAAAGLSSRTDVETTLRHEVLGHYGLNTLAPADKRAVLEAILTTRNRRDLAPVWAQIDAAYSDMPESIRAEEVFAELASRERGTLGEWWDKVLVLLAQGLRRVGLLHGSTTKAELYDLARRIGQGIRSGERRQQTFPASDQAQFARAEPTNSQAFQRWFGNSQVTDASGDPRVVYHGTGSDFWAFDAGRLGENTGHMTAPLGFFFTESRAEAQRYAEQASAGVSADERVIDVYLSIQNPRSMTLDEFLAVDSFEEARALRAQLQRAGYDGIRLAASGRTQWIAFEPTQAKSASGNRGTWNPNDADMRFSRERLPPRLNDTQRAALSKIGSFATPESLPKRARRVLGELRRELVQGVFDQFQPLRLLDSDAYMQARLSRGTDGALEGLFLHGPPILRDGALDVKPDGQGLRGVLADLQGEHDLFLAWVAGHRAAQLKFEGREHLFSGKEVQALQALDQGTMPDGKPRAAAYRKALAGYNRYQKAVLDIGEKAGLYSADNRKKWESEFYIPFFRDFDAEHNEPSPFRETGTQKVIQQLEGGAQPLGDLLTNVLENHSRILTASMRNMAADKALAAAEKANLAVKVESGNKDTHRVMRNGEAVHYRVDDPLLVDALTMLHFNGDTNKAMRVLGSFKRVLSFGVTVSPGFRIRNLLRDSISALAVAEAGWNPIRNVVDGWKASGQNADTFQRLLAGGGAVRFGALNDGAQSVTARRLIATGVKPEHILDTPAKAKRVLQSGWQWWQAMGDRAETVNRAVIYDRAIKAGKNHLEASYEARDLLDFTMGGKWAAVRFLAQTVPFLNARLQGMYKLGRGAKANPARFAAVVGAVALASAVSYLLQRDDEEYKALPDWARDSYWCINFGGTMLFIPKPFEVGAMGTVIERGTELMLAGDDYRARDFANTLTSVAVDQLAMNPIPQAVRPLLEVAFNRDMFRGRPIDSMGQERLPAEDRYTARTSAPAVLAGPALHVSPNKLEHLTRGYFGWLGLQALNVTDLLVRPMTDLPSNPARDVHSVANWPVAGEFVKDAGAVSSKYVDRFYEMQRRNDELYAAYSAARAAGDVERAMELEDTGAVRFRKAHNLARRQMQDVNRRIRMATADPSLSAAEKGELLRNFHEVRHRIAEYTDQTARAR